MPTALFPKIYPASEDSVITVRVHSRADEAHYDVATGGSPMVTIEMATLIKSFIICTDVSFLSRSTLFYLHTAVDIERWLVAFI